MPSYVAFLRAVDVGGRFVRMAELRTAMTGAGSADGTLPPAAAETVRTNDEKWGA